MKNYSAVIGSNDGLTIDFIEVFEDETQSDELKKCFKLQKRIYEVCRIVDLNDILKEHI